MTSKKDRELASKITEARCRTWSENPLTNPITGATINHKGPTYNVFEQVCREKFNITLGESSEASPNANEPSHTLPKLPKDIDGIVMPQNKKQWSENSLINRDFLKILVLITNPKEKSINEYVFENMLSYAKICELGLQYKLVPTADIEKIQNYQEKFTHFSVRENLKLIGVKFIKKEFIDTIDNFLKNKRIELDSEIVYRYPDNILNALKIKENEVVQNIKYLQSDILTNGLDDDKYNKAVNIAGLLVAMNYYKLIYSDTKARVANWGSSMNPITSDNSYVQLSVKITELFRFITELRNLDTERNVQYKSITDQSKSATLPTSISRRRNVRQQFAPPEPADILDDDGTTYKKRTEGPVNMKEFSDYVEEVSTGRESFKHHSLLSKMQPLSRESLEAFPEKTRVQLLKELRLQCNEMKDNLSGKRFDRMSKKNLHLVVQIGPPGKKRCYYVRNIYKYWETIAKNNTALREPETRAKVTDEEKTDIMHKIKYLKKDAVNPEIVSIKKDPKLKMIIELDTTGQYYTFNVRRELGSLSYLINDLGVLPANIDLTHADGGAAYYSSEATIANIVDAFDKGRIMSSNFIPYRCCKMHFKNRSYWTGDEAEINRKFKLFADEVYSLL